MELALAFLVAVVAVAASGYFRFRRQLDRLEQKIRKLRDIALRDLRYRRVAPDEAAHAAKLAELDGLVHEMTSAGLEVLGDAISQDEKQPTRWFVDRDHVIFGWVGVIPTAARKIRVAVLMSRAGERVVLTRCAPSVMLAEAPYLKSETLPLTTPLAEAVPRHRTRAGDPAALARVATLEDATGELERLRARTIAWRNAEPAADLLDRDLHAILGRHYPKLAPHLARRLGIELPRARVV